MSKCRTIGNHYAKEIIIINHYKWNHTQKASGNCWLFSMGFSHESFGKTKLSFKLNPDLSIPRFP